MQRLSTYVVIMLALLPVDELSLMKSTVTVFFFHFFILLTSQTEKEILLIKQSIVNLLLKEILKNANYLLMH